MGIKYETKFSQKQINAFMSAKKIFFIIMLVIGLIVFIYLIRQNEAYQSTVKEIKFEDSINIEVKNAYNERGIYILNDTFFVSSATFFISKSNIKIKDDAIWRPKGNKHIPRISDIIAPFLISKNKNNDTILIVKDENKILLLLIDE